MTGRTPGVRPHESGARAIIPRRSRMMFLQFAIWGCWATVFGRGGGLTTYA